MTGPVLRVTLGRGAAAGTVLCRGQSRRVSGGSRQVPVSGLGSCRHQAQGAPAAPLRRLSRRPDPMRHMKAGRAGILLAGPSPLPQMRGIE